MSQRKRIAVIEPEFVVKTFDDLSIDDNRSNLQFVPNSPSGLKIESQYSNELEKFDSFFWRIVGEIYLLNVIEKERDKIYKLIEMILKNLSSLVLAGLGDLKRHAEEKMLSVQQYIWNKIHKHDSSYKREEERMAH